MNIEDCDIEKLPIGSKIKLGEDTPEQRLAKGQFHRYMFEYFEEITTGQTGWGVSFMDWLQSAKGWENLGLDGYQRVFSRILSMEEEEE